MIDRMKDRGRQLRDGLRRAFNRSRSEGSNPDFVDTPLVIAPTSSRSRDAESGHSASRPMSNRRIGVLGTGEPVTSVSPHTERFEEQSSPSSSAPAVLPALSVCSDILYAHGPNNLPDGSVPGTCRHGSRNNPWIGVKTLLRILDASTGVFAPLKSAVGELQKCIEIFEDTDQTRQEYRQLRDHVDSLCMDVASFIKSDAPPAMMPVVAAIARGLQRETEMIQQKGHANRLARLAGANEDLDAILKSYDRIHKLLERLSMNANMKLWTIIDTQATEARLDRLGASSAAMYNSRESDSLRRNPCTPQTRTNILMEMLEWSRDPDAQRVYWLNGMAGTGKTTIAYSLCQQLEAAGQLAASFFCARQLPDCRDVTMILPSIAFQLASFSRPMRYAIAAALEHFPSAGKQAISKQFEVLISEPLRQVGDSLPGGLVIVIDALDECDNGEGVGRMLVALLRSISKSPLKFCITSRPEPELVVKMQTGSAKRELRLHEIDGSMVRADIRVYLMKELEAHQLLPIQLDTLVDRSGVLFIYAATIVRYLGERKTYRSSQRLKQVLEKSPSSLQSDREIDILYTDILQASIRNNRLESWERNEMEILLRMVVCAMEPLTLDALAGLTNSTTVESVREAIEPLASVIYVSESTRLVTTLHESFPEYLLDDSRSGEFYCDSKQQHQRYTRVCLERIRGIEPPFNVCELESSYYLDSEAKTLNESIQSIVSDHLFYACRYWISHLVIGCDLADVLEEVIDFLSLRLLVWLEVMNIKRQKYTAAGILHQLGHWLSSQAAPNEICRTIQDAWMFATEFANSGSSESTPHLYVSMLALWPEDREVSRLYSGKVGGLVQISGTAMDNRMRAPIATWKVSASVYCIAYSPDGSRLVSGLENGSLCVWSAYTGEILGQPLTGHVGAVWAVAYSVDENRIASGSADTTVRIWDAHTGRAYGEPCTGHAGTVLSVAYSPNGKHLVSGSEDRTIRIWEASTGELSHIIWTHHKGKIYSVAYSADSMYLASGSGDGTISIWDAESGQRHGNAVTGHNDRIRSVMFSPDGMNVVSCSYDRTVRVWDTLTGMQLGDPLTGHNKRIICGALSHDGTLVASASDDKTVCIWNPQSGKLVGQPLASHTGGVWAVAFSPDGQYIASGSEDETICIWHVKSTSTHDQPSDGHSGIVYSVACSPSGPYFASGSADETICIWDMRTGQLSRKPLTCDTGEIYSVAYSPNGDYIAAGSDRGTVLIWDVLTGETVGKPLERHTRGVWSVAYSPDGAYLASGSEDTTVIIWNTSTGEMVGEPLHGHTSYVRTVAYSSDGLHLSSGSEDCTIRIWNTSTGQMQGSPFRGHTDWVMAVAYSPDGAHIASGSLDSTVRIWDARSSTSYGQPLTGHTSWVRCVAYSPDGAYIISGSRDCDIRIWDAYTGECCGRYEGHDSYVSSVACSFDGAYIVSCSYDETVRVWEMFKPATGNSSDYGKVSYPHSQRDWNLDKDTGWVMRNDGARLVWLPPETRLLVQHPAVNVISRKGSLKLDFTNAKLGKDWSKCYRR
ncbi:Notchless protein [Ceratobasidium sp. AG-Ba]|nr:Notchless protein [Ceratobasidium sp. AG-Ba]